MALRGKQKYLIWSLILRVEKRGEHQRREEEEEEEEEEGGAKKVWKLTLSMGIIKISMDLWNFCMDSMIFGMDLWRFVWIYGCGLWVVRNLTL